MDPTDLDPNAERSGQRPAEAIPAVDPRALVAQIGSEVASVLSSALERVTALAASGRIDRAGLVALRDEIERARRTGIMGQQVGRLAAGPVRISPERLGLSDLTREALRQRAREIEARGLALRQVFAPAEVTSDATLLYSLLQAMLDWSFEHAVSRIDLAIDVGGWPPCARLACSFAHQLPDQVEADRTAAPGGAAPERLDTMSWQLLQQTAHVLGLRLQRQDRPGRTTLTVEFPGTPTAHLDVLELRDPDGARSARLDARPLAGRRVLVVTPRGEVRGLAREALRPLGPQIDFVATVEEASMLCRDAVPHAIVHDAALADDRLEQLRGALLAAAPALAFIEITEDGKGFETLNVGGRQRARVGREAIVGSLPAALAHEWARLTDLPR
jgi:CheY-like chemotaxis protein